MNKSILVLTLFISEIVVNPVWAGIHEDSYEKSFCTANKNSMSVTLASMPYVFDTAEYDCEETSDRLMDWIIAN